MKQPSNIPTHIEAVADAAASSMRRDIVSEPDATEVTELQKVIYGYFGPAYKINTWKTPEQQDRELAEAILVAGYRKSIAVDSDSVLRILEAAGVDKADQFDALVAVQKLTP